MSPLPPPSRAGIAVAVVAYLVALTGAAALALRVVTLGLGLFPPVPLTTPALAWAVDLGWLLAFGVQHSGMARQGVKDFLTHHVPPRLERSCYAAASGLVLVGMEVSWQPLGGPILWAAPAWLVVVPAAAGLGLAAINLCFDHAGLFGLRQAWATAPAPDNLLVLGPYRYVRHPLMACLLLFLWAQPIMTPTLAVLAGGLTVIILVGVRLEERDLVSRFGAAYEDYRRRVPALLPWRAPAPPSVHPPRG
jgi:protein-S-isoprenylcysteine O-methyltransferase Ste14